MRTFDELEEEYIGDPMEAMRPFAVIRVVDGRVVAVEGGGGTELYVVAYEDGAEDLYKWPETQPGSFAG